ncbi:hypothetical protein ANN_25307 [Periplaneta americana]|uniref:Per a allergen n=1 Tax=Periplaneta americana TaxID=6978 RepID=A0ABQ8S0Z0_PERAM|nr:hypothetical protein ANN_25307 [Periplaneta americana]
MRLTGFLEFGKDAATLPPREFDESLSILLNKGCDWLLTGEYKISVTVFQPMTTQVTTVQPMTGQLCTVIKPQVSIILGYAIERELAKSHGGCRRRCSANDKSALYRYKTASIDYSRICNRKTISEKSRRLEIQYCRRRSMTFGLGKKSILSRQRTSHNSVLYLVNTFGATGVAQAVARLPADPKLRFGLRSIPAWADYQGDCFPRVFPEL